MTQRTKNYKLTTITVTGGALLLIVISFLSWHAFSSHAPDLPVDVYLSNARGLAGNRYEVQARIERQLDTRAGTGRIILTRNTGSGRTMPVFDGGILQNFNPEPGQLYALTVEVAGDGLLELVEARKL